MLKEYFAYPLAQWPTSDLDEDLSRPARLLIDWLALNMLMCDCGSGPATRLPILL
jgi:hypothetical protein